MIAGHSDKKYLENLFKNTPTNLKYIGRLDFDNTLEYFDKTTLFVNTSTIDGDGFPNTYIQAWLRKTPVLTLNIDPDNIIKEKALGLVCNDINDMAEKIVNLFNDYASYSTLAEKGYEYAVKNHSIQVMTDNFIEKIDCGAPDNV
jgi:glycosyltransferase involved in cell wall biosynthesis